MPGFKVLVLRCFLPCTSACFLTPTQPLIAVQNVRISSRYKAKNARRVGRGDVKSRVRISSRDKAKNARIVGRGDVKSRVRISSRDKAKNARRVGRGDVKSRVRISM